MAKKAKGGKKKGGKKTPAKPPKVPKLIPTVKVIDDTPPATRIDVRVAYKMRLK